MKALLLALFLSLECAAVAVPDKTAWLESWRKTNPVWRGIHLPTPSNEAVDALIEELPKIAATGVNVIVVEMSYSFGFKSHPELRRGKGINVEHAKALVAAGHKNGVRLIPGFDCLGH